MTETILVLCAHNDDNIIGVGGTIAKYSKEGKNVKTIIFTYGELSPPHLKPEVVREMRYKESVKAEQILTGGGVEYLGLQEGHFLDEEKKVLTKLRKIIRDLNPTKIFTHSINDPHPDHKAVHQIVMKVAKQIEIYSFDVWNVVNVRHRNKPLLIVDISDQFSKKVHAFQAHKSQRHVMVLLLGKIFLKDWTNGIRHGCRFAEVFVKIQ